MAQWVEVLAAEIPDTHRWRENQSYLLTLRAAVLWYAPLSSGIGEQTLENWKVRVPGVHDMKLPNNQ